MAAIAMLHHMPTSQAVENATTLVRGSTLSLHSLCTVPENAQIPSQDRLYFQVDWTLCKQLHQAL